MGVERENSPEFVAEALLAHRGTKVSLWLRRTLLLTNFSLPFLLVSAGRDVLWPWNFAIVAHLVLLVGLFVAKSNWLGPILNRLPTKEKIVWLTIDDGPSNDTVAIAEMLAAQGVSATFFLQGKKLAQFPEALSAIKQFGHTVGNHTYRHDLAWFWVYLPWNVRAEVDDFQRDAARNDFPLIPAFRCPAGLKNPFLHTILARRNLTLVGWTIRAYDGIRCHAEKSTSHILQRLEPGAIILVHEGKNDAQNQPASLEFIRKLVAAVHSRGYRFAKA